MSSSENFPEPVAERVFVRDQLGAAPKSEEKAAFQPISFGLPEPVEEAVAEPEEEILPPPPPGIPEDEVARMVEQAYEDGARDGKLQAQTELSSLCEALGEALVTLGPLREQLMQESEEELLKLAVAVARKVILREITLDPAILAGMAAAAVEFATREDEIVVRLNRAQYQQLAEDPEYVRLFADNRRVSFKGDPALPAASCLVETVRGNIDAGVDSQLDEILRRLIEEQHTRHEEEPEP
ncbi:FliH/SctL family protein [Geomesophilobacter sediminis]|uniref:Flagellar assembly protein FliH n=1 Tax=Geomesophilobacter sediminis TaxID=2798584 RepID=A0A8J7JLC9_9BACT|nr:FliH/SctL family protein [Geomesophilobacter sediminis]MBJ6724745.1 flagellar assembly protein FliH [Geomesophilobacter sediminis]